MSRLSRYLPLIALIAFILACNAITQPFKNVQNAASTVESIATANPLQTLQSIATSLPVQTLQALPSSLPELETAMPDLETAMPNFDQVLNPKGQPVAEWNHIPVMSDATAGQEFSSTSYSFVTPSAPIQVKDFYDAKLKDLGWTSFMFGSQVTDQGGLMLFQKDKSLLTVTVAVNPNGDKTTVVNFQLVTQ